jgi:hypothetical protein
LDTVEWVTDLQNASNSVRSSEWRSSILHSPSLIEVSKHMILFFKDTLSLSVIRSVSRARIFVRISSSSLTRNSEISISVLLCSYVSACDVSSSWIPSKAKREYSRGRGSRESTLGANGATGGDAGSMIPTPRIQDRNPVEADGLSTVNLLSTR